MNIINVFVVDDSEHTAGRLKKGLDGVIPLRVVGVGTIYDFKHYAGTEKIDAVVSNGSINLNMKNFIRYVTGVKKMPIIALVNSQQESSDALLSGATECVIKVLNIIDDNTFKAVGERLRDVFSKDRSIGANGLLNNMDGVNNLNGVIAIGASTGGTEATLDVLSKLPRRIPGIVVTQHMMDKFIGIYAERLNRLCSLEVKEASDGDVISPGTVLIAPGDRHMAVKKVPHGYGVRCFKGHLVSGHCPSVDVLFESMADVVGREGVGIILTGMGEDGARGLKKMRDKGAYTIGQSEEGCCVYGMPQKAYELGGVTVQRALKSIPIELMNYLKKR